MKTIQLPEMGYGERLFFWQCSTSTKVHAPSLNPPREEIEAVCATCPHRFSESNIECVGCNKFRQ